jgi:hypothetical protein
LSAVFQTAPKRFFIVPELTDEQERLRSGSWSAGAP